MRLLAFIVALCSVQAFATEYERKTFNYTDFGNDGFSRNFYACSFAEAALNDHLVKLGAINVRTSCFGGIEPWAVMPVSLRATFEAPKAGQDFSRSERVVIRGQLGSNNSCFFHTKLLRKLIPLFPNVAINSSRSTCSDNSSRWNYDLQVSM
jgi:hypothetical protein